jgi:hypothetical protein
LEKQPVPRIYELPTHLEVEDQLIAGLTARQLLRLVIGASLAYGVWDQVPWLPQQARLALAGGLAVTGAVFALLQPRGRPLDAWLLAAALFVVLPRQLVWRPGAAQQRKPRLDQAGWAELELHPEWVETEPDRQLIRSDSASGRSCMSGVAQRRHLTPRRCPW